MISLYNSIIIGSALEKAIVEIVKFKGEIIVIIVIVTAMGEAIVGLFSCLIPFLEQEQLSTLPFTVASMLSLFPDTLHKEIVELLCSSLIPVTLSKFYTTYVAHLFL